MTTTTSTTITSTTTMTTTIEQYGIEKENDICDKTLYLTLIICGDLKLMIYKCSFAIFRDL